MLETPHNYELDKLKTYTCWSIFLHEINPFIDATDGERQEFLNIATKLSTAINKLYKSDRMNYANIRNAWLHCHWHIILCYSDARTIAGHNFNDPNWGANYVLAHERRILKNVIATIRTDYGMKLISGEKSLVKK